MGHRLTAQHRATRTAVQDCSSPRHDCIFCWVLSETVSYQDMTVSSVDCCPRLFLTKTRLYLLLTVVRDCSSPRHDFIFCWLLSETVPHQDTTVSSVDCCPRLFLTKTRLYLLLAVVRDCSSPRHDCIFCWLLSETIPHQDTTVSSFGCCLRLFLTKTRLYLLLTVVRDARHCVGNGRLQARLQRCHVALARLRVVQGSLQQWWQQSPLERNRGQQRIERGRSATIRGKQIGNRPWGGRDQYKCAWERNWSRTAGGSSTEKRNEQRQEEQNGKMEWTTSAAVND